jgi:putative transposase
MYARGMTVREIQGFLAEMYPVDVSPDLISRVTDEVMSEVTAWRRHARWSRCTRSCSSTP